jgi:hypothetical protein
MNNIIINNTAIYDFVNEYKYEIKYYCSRTIIPNNYSFATYKDCTKFRYNCILASFFLIFFRLIYIYLLPGIIKKIIRDSLSNERPLLFLLNLIRRNNISQSNNSTRVTERSIQNGNEEVFVKQNTRNIIVENKNEFSIDEKIDNNNINLSLSFKNNSEEQTNSNNINDKSNINIIHN